MIRLFAYLNFSLVLSTALILTSNAFVLRSYDGLPWLIGVALSTGFLYFLLSQKLITRYLQKPTAFANSEWAIALLFALPPIVWLSLNFELADLEPSLILIFIVISLILSTYLCARRHSMASSSEFPSHTL